MNLPKMFFMKIVVPLHCVDIGVLMEMVFYFGFAKIPITIIAYGYSHSANKPIFIRKWDMCAKIT